MIRFFLTRSEPRVKLLAGPLKDKSSKLFVFKCDKTDGTDVKVLLERFHLNGHTIGLCTRTQKVEPPYYKTRPFTVGVEELNLTLVYSAGKQTQLSSRKRIFTSFVSTLLFPDISSLL